MSIFESLSEQPEFLKLNAKRASALDLLINHKESIESLDKARPSLRAFERIEFKMDDVIATYEEASCAVASWFTKNGGDTLTDSGYKAYRVKAVKVLNEAEVVRESYHDLLKEKGLLVPPAPKPEVTQSDLIAAMQTLAESTGRQAEATKATAEASLLHHKTPTMSQPTFHSNESRNNPLAWTNFRQRFELFTVDSLDDKSR